MSQTINLDGQAGGQLTLPLHNSPLNVKVGQVGTITLGQAQRDIEYNVFPVVFNTKELMVKIDVEENTGQLVLSWDSSTEHASQPNDLAFSEDITSTVHSTEADTLPTRSTKDTTVASDSSQPAPQSLPATRKPAVAKRLRPRKTDAVYNTRRGSRSKQDVQIDPNQRAFIIKQLGKLINVHKDSELFNDPVDTSQYPQYKAIINRPMDFRTILRNCKNSVTHYPTVEAVMADFDLVINNAIRYNGLVHAVSQKARSTSKWFKKRMKLIPSPQDDHKAIASGTFSENRESREADTVAASTHPRDPGDELAPSRQSKIARTDPEVAEPIST